MRYFPPRKPPRAWRGTTTGSTRAWRKQRERVLHRDGYQCTAILIATGERCPVHAPAPLEIHHTRDGLGIEAPDHELTTVCRKHHPRGAA